MLPLSNKIDKIALIYPVNNFMPPLGLLTLGAMLEKANKQVVVLPMYDYHYVPDTKMMRSSVEQLRQFDPEMIGIGFMSAESRPAEVVIKYLRENFKDAIIVAGGRHPSCFPREVLQWGAHCVVVGEGEPTLMRLIDALAKKIDGLQEIPGLAFLNEHGGMRLNPPVEERADLGIIPAYHLIPYQRFIDTRMALVGRYLKAGWLSTSRGCFSKCIYCRDPHFGNRLRFRPMDAIMEDIRIQLRNYDLNCFYIIDDMFAINEKRVIEFCNKFMDIQRESKKKLHFAATARTDTLTMPMIDAMKRAGCTQLSIGVESGSQRILDFLNTRKKVSDAIRAFNMLKGSGIDTFANFIVGIPLEEEADMDDTVALIRRIRPTLVGVSFLTAYPGTPLYSMALERGWISAESFTALSFKHSDDISQLKCSVPQSALKGRKGRIYRETFTSSILNFLRKREACELFTDIMKIAFINPAKVLSLIIPLLRGNLDKFKELYRFLIYRNAWK